MSTIMNALRLQFTHRRLIYEHLCLRMRATVCYPVNRESQLGLARLGGPLRYLHKCTSLYILNRQDLVVPFTTNHHSYMWKKKKNIKMKIGQSARLVVEV